MPPFNLVEGDKFAILAMTNVATSLATDAVLVDGTIAALGIPVETIDTLWQASLGTLAVEALRRSNLVFVRGVHSANPELLDGEHQQLAMAVVEVFWLLQLSGVPYYESATILKGSITNGRLHVRAYDDLAAHQFWPANGARQTRVTQERLLEASRLAETWRAFLAQAGQYLRFKRGLNILLDGLQEQLGQERLHACVRALEALIHPAQGKTRRQFATRCQTFATATPAARTFLEECFDMRSDIEHLNDPAIDEAVALRRVRQIEALATRSYTTVLASAQLQQHFQSDDAIDAFWLRSEPQRRALWGPEFDPESVQ